MAEHNDLGKRGEELAAEYLAEKGYEILERNWRAGRGELDIIAKAKNGILIFVEVKTRSYNTMGEPEDAVNERKESILMGTAGAYMEKINYTWEVRFDIISVIISAKGNIKIQHFEDVFF